MKWTETGQIGSGSITLASKHPTTGQLQISESIIFAKEKLVSRAFTHYSPTDESVVEALTEVDYKGLDCLGLFIVGGQMNIISKRPDQTVSSTSQFHFV